MNTRSLTVRTLLTGVVIAAGALASAAGQPGTSGQSSIPPVSEPQKQPPMDAAALRKLIEVRLDEHKAGIKRLEDASKKLAEGGDPAAIGRELVESFRDGRRASQTGGGNRPERGTPPAGGGGQGGGRNSEYDFNGPSLKPEERAKVRELLDQKHPELLQKINALGANNAEMTDRLIDGVGGRIRWIEAMREKEPEEASLRVKEVGTGLDVMKLGREVTDAKTKGDATAEAAIRTRLRVVMSDRFDTRQKLNHLKITQLRRQADEIEKTLADNDKKRDEVIDRRTDEFLKLMDGKGKKSESETPHKP